MFRTRAAKKDEDLLDKVQSYLAALLHNGQIVGDHTLMEGQWRPCGYSEPA